MEHNLQECYRSGHCNIAGYCCEVYYKAVNTCILQMESRLLRGALATPAAEVKEAGKLMEELCPKAAILRLGLQCHASGCSTSECI